MFSAIRTILTAILTTYTSRLPEKLSSDFMFFREVKLDEEKALQGFLGLMGQTFELEIYCREYSSLTTYFASVRAAIKALEQTTHTYFIQSVEIDPSSPDLWEGEIGFNRKIITFTVFYQV